jgi:hypothetical protein
VNRSRSRTALALAALAPIMLGAHECGNYFLAPEDDGLRIEIALSSHELRLGEQGAVTMRLRNLTAEAVTLTFSSTCQLNVYIRRSSGQLVYPYPGGHACGDAITSITLEPFAEHSEIFRLHAIHPDWEYLRDVARIAWLGFPITPGRYRVYAELGHNYSGTELRSSEATLEVR